MGTLRSFVKYKRKELGITQEELTTNAGLGLNFVRDLEQSKKTLRKLFKIGIIQFSYQFALSLGRTDKVMDTICEAFSNQNDAVKAVVNSSFLNEDYKSGYYEIFLKKMGQIGFSK